MVDFFKVARTGQVLSSFSWVKPTETEQVPLVDSLDRVLAEEVTAAADVPHFTRAVMDGYAVRAADTFGCSEAQPSYLDCRVTVDMGMPAREKPAPGEACGISTGGMMPPGTDAVVMWEYAREKEGLLEVFRPVAPGENVVQIGEDVRRGETVLEAGRRLRPADVGLLAGLGRSLVQVRRRPRVALLSTGDELVETGVEPGPGQVRNINQYSLGSWVRHFGAEALLQGIVRDDFDEIDRALRKGVESADMVLISGGSSAGVRDLTRSAVEGLDAPGLMFHGLAVRPGKPTVVGAHGERPVFGLPGHPVSAMVIFLVLVRQVLNMMLGRAPDAGVLRVPALLSDNLPSQAGREDYYQVRLRPGRESLEAVPIFRKSGLVSAMVRAEAMVRVPGECEGLEAGETVQVEIYA